MILDLKSLSPSSEVLTPSISIYPESASTILSSESIIEDFPAPVLPTIPTLQPPSIEKDKFFRTKGRLGR